MTGEYTIAGGLTDSQRLARQAHVMAAATEAFLRRVGVAAGWACLDVGCGDGQVSVALARLAGEEGCVVGIDVDDEALDLAREAAARAGVRARFVHADATGSGFRQEGFDLAYSRLLLSHLADPMTALRRMRADLRSGGAIAVEDLFLGTLHSEPASPALDRLQEVYGETVRFHGGDPTIGPRLGALMRAAGLGDVSEQVVVNPMRSVDEKLFLAQLVRNMRASILEAGAAGEEEIDGLAADVERAARDPGRVFFQARIHQVVGRDGG
jgi:ubiquinone/menaquinone biosynthesis C-methylase UbiE